MGHDEPTSSGGAADSGVHGLRASAGAQAAQAGRPVNGGEFIKMIGPQAGAMLKQHSLAVYSYASEHDHHLPQGTGTLLNIASRHFFITAAHVAATVSGEDRLFVGNPASGHHMSLGGKLVHTDEAATDIAILAVDAERVPAVRQLPALSLSQTWLKPTLPPAWFVLSGFPREWHRKDPERRALLTNPYQIVVSPYVGDSDALKGFDPTHHFLMTYGKNAQRDDPNGVRYPESLEGMSGACVWRLADVSPNPATWSAGKEMRVVGIQTGEYEGKLDRRVVKGTTWLTVVEIIAAAFPDLKPAIELHIA
jgi:hypothetical protein